MLWGTTCEGSVRKYSLEASIIIINFDGFKKIYFLFFSIYVYNYSLFNNLSDLYIYIYIILTLHLLPDS